MPDATDPTSLENLSPAARRVMTRLNNDHVRIARVLDGLEQALKVDDDRDTDWQLISDFITYLQEYPDTVHHPVEDQLFDRVLDKGLTPAERELVHFNLSQHVEIIAATAQLAADVNNILNDIVVPIAQIEEHFERYIELQRVHMRNEIHHLFPLAERQLGESDWQEIEVSIAQHKDPLFDLQLEKFTGLYEYITGQ
jgi:hemerythrin-like domain-containing protein